MYFSVTSRKFLPTAAVFTTTLTSRSFLSGCGTAAYVSTKSTTTTTTSSSTVDGSCSTTSLSMASSPTNRRFSSLASIDDPKKAYEDFNQLIPKIGLGTFGLDNTEDNQSIISTAISSAINDIGYKRIDCAPVYFNEHIIGDTLKEQVLLSSDNANNNNAKSISRDDLFIVSKLACPFHQKEHVKIGVTKTLNDLNLDYIDLYLIHWPQAFIYNESKFNLETLLQQRGYPNEDIDDSNNGNNIDLTVSIHDTWKGMEELVYEGKVKYIGISNFPISLIHELLTKATIPPIMNQIESHVYLQQWPLFQYCTKRYIHVQSYSPLGTPGYKQPNEPNILTDEPILQTIASKHNISVAQVCILWSIQRGGRNNNNTTSVVVKSSNPTRQKENYDIVTNYETGNIKLSENEMKQIKSLGSTKNYRYFRPEEWWEDMAMAVFD